MKLSQEAPETQAEIIRKSQRLAIAYNKGPQMFISDDTDITQLGSRTRRG